MKNSNDTVGNRTRDLPACTSVPQPTAPPRAPPETSITITIHGVTSSRTWILIKSAVRISRPRMIFAIVRRMVIAKAERHFPVSCEIHATSHRDGRHTTPDSGVVDCVKLIMKTGAALRMKDTFCCSGTAKLIAVTRQAGGWTRNWLLKHCRLL